MSLRSESQKSLIRAFVAVPISESSAKELESFVDSLRKMARLRWVTAAQFHITLRFLGEQTPEVIDRVKGALNLIHFSPFDIELSYAGAFPNMNSPRALWLAGKQGINELTELATKVNKAIDALGLIPEQRKFSPHLTLARTNGTPLPAQLIEALKKPPRLTWNCNKFFLMRSKLTPNGAVYSKIPLS